MAVKKDPSGKSARLARRPQQASSAKIQTALYQIADAASAVTDMQSFYRRLHEIVGTLMYAENFFIALHDPQTDLITWPYYVDTVDIEQPEPIPLKEQHGGTGWILRTGRTLSHAEGTVSYIIEHGEAEQTGTVSDAIGVPLKSDGKTVGVLLIQSYRDEIKYNLKHVEIMNFVAQHISLALTRARAIEETRQRNSELAIINSVQAALAAQLDMHGIYKAVGEKLREIFNYQDAGVYSADFKTRTVTIEYAFEKGRKFERISIPMNSLYEYIVAANKTFVFNGNVSEFAAQFEDYKVPVGELPKSGVFVPVPRKREADLSVYLILEDVDGARFFSASDVRLLETLANAMSIALENARLFDETQQRNAELAIINSVQEGLASKLEMQAIYNLVGDKIHEIFDAQVIGIGTFDHVNRLTHFHYGIENGQRLDFPAVIPFSGIAEYLIRSRQPVWINQDMERRKFEFGMEETPGLAHPAKSLVSVPLIVGNEVKGAITLHNIDRENAFTESDVRLLATLANSMSVALDNARLWEQEKMFRKALQRELEIGREIQQGFLPETLPRVDGWEIAASLMSAREVAGDFYDAFELPDGCIGLVIADVCDKGVGAALFMTLFRSLIRAAANLDYFEQTEKADAPHSSTERLQRAVALTNNYIAETHGESGMFATLFFGILDPRDGKLIYINGGHESPLIVRAGAVRESLCKTGPAVGILANGRFEILETQVGPGDLFFAFTDGVPDCQNPRGEFFGRERLLDFIQQRNESAPELVGAMEAELRQYIAGANQFDDITLMAVRRS